MNHKISCTILSCCFFSLWAPAAKADPVFFSYTLASYPVGLAECEPVANSLASKLEATGLDIYSTACARGDSFDGGSNIVLTYVAEEAPLSSIAKDDISSAWGNFAACQQNLASQVAIFEQATGLSPWVSYCTPKNGRMHIQAQGQTTRKFVQFFAGIDDFHRYPQVNDSRALAKAIRNTLGTLDLVVAKVSIEGMHLSFSYYSDKHYRFGFVRYPAYESATLCESKKKDVELALQETVQTLTQFCAGTAGYPSEAKTLYTFGFQKGAQLPTRFPSVSATLDTTLYDASPDVYTSFAMCEADKQRVADFYRDTFKRDIASTLCSLKWQDALQYNVLLFEHL